MNAAFLAFERASLFGLVALVVALFAQWILNGRVPASWRVWLWRAALLQSALALVPFAPLRLAILPPSPPVSIVAPAPISRSAPSLPSEAFPATNASVASSSAPQNAPATASAPPEKAAPVSLVAPDIEAVRPPHVLDFRPVVFAVYALGLVVQLVALTRSFARVRQLMRACSPVENTDSHVQLHEIARRMNAGSRLPRLLENESGAPFLTGVLRPSIVLPRALLQLQNPALEPVLAHELAHLKRRDLVWNALLWPIQTLLWFHPLVWTARRFLTLETESACDEMVLSSTDASPKFYGALLLNTMNNSQTPLAVGVNDGFFALKTRLNRLNQAPKRPNKAIQVAFVAALCCAFGALIPLRFVARAQEVTPLSSQNNTIRGTVVDSEGKPLAGATVYTTRALANGREPLETTTTDASGAFEFSSPARDRLSASVFVDAGERGLGQNFTSHYKRGQLQPIEVRIAPPVRVKLRVLDAQEQPVPNQKVFLWRVGPSPGQWLELPRPVLARFQSATDARGEAAFAFLPKGNLAQFVLADQTSKRTTFGLGDLRGGQFAPLSTEDFVRLSAPETSLTIHLLPPVRLEGRVSLPDGRAAGDVPVLARRINAAEAAGRIGERDQLIAQTRSNAQGQYVLDGLRPGHYVVWVYPEKRLTRDLVGPSTEQTLQEKVSRVDFTLSRGALVQGVVTSQATKQPVKGQTMWLFDSQENNQYAITDARGRFQFRTLGGKQCLRVHTNGTNSPPPGFILPATSRFDFWVQNGQKREFVIELPSAPVTKQTTGTVVGSDGKPVPNAGVLYRIAGSRIDSQLHRAATDANGRFSLPPRWSVRPSQLWAVSGQSTTTRSTIALVGDDVTLRLQANGWASVAGTVRDENDNPLEGVKVWAYTLMGGIAGGPESTTTRDGRFRFGHLFPGAKVAIIARRKGYVAEPMVFDTLKAGATCVMNASMKTANATLAGRIIAADGTPAVLYHVEGATTKADGRFFLPEISPGPLALYVYSPKSDRRWGPYRATGNQEAIVFRLTEAKRETGYGLPSMNRARVATLVGKIAPEIKAAHWANGRKALLSSLRGQVVLLVFDNFTFGGNTEVEDVVPSFKGRVQVVGVQSGSNVYFSSGSTSWSALDKLARTVPFPLALDSTAFLPRGSDGRTSQIYGNASSVVIGRDGKILYAGDELDRAITFAASQ